jgi:hypothetical protein
MEKEIRLVAGEVREKEAKLEKDITKENHPEEAHLTEEECIQELEGRMAQDRDRISSIVRLYQPLAELTHVAFPSEGSFEEQVGQYITQIEARINNVLTYLEIPLEPRPRPWDRKDKDLDEKELNDLQ